MKQILALHPALRKTERRSSSKSFAEYLLCTLICTTLRAFIQATNRERVVFPEPLTPINSK